MKKMTCYLTPESHLPPFMAFPRFLLKYDLSETTKVLYILLLDRARVSMKKDEWMDAEGHVYLHYTIKELAVAIRKSEMTVKAALSSLEKSGLIIRKRTKYRQPSCIYVLMDMDTDSILSLTGQVMDKKLSVREKENYPPEGQSSFPQTDRKLSTIINNRERVREKDILSYRSPRIAMGQFQNVFLTEHQLADLKQKVPCCEEYIERLSRYMASTGKAYADHAATIIDWAVRDQRVSRKGKRDYSCQEGESL